jgi:periplasmic protein TonB
MLPGKREDLKAKLAGGAAALAIEAGFVAALLFGLTVNYVKPEPRSMSLMPVLEKPILHRDPPPPNTSLKKIYPDDLSPPDVVINNKPIDAPLQPPVIPTDTIETFNSGGDTAVLPDPPLNPPQDIIRVAAAIDPRYSASLQPDYPAAARRDDLTGRVLLRVLVGIDGRIRQAQVHRSSGHTLLDQTAMEHALKKWRFKPATEDGQAVEAWLTVPISFELKHS